MSGPPAAKRRRLNDALHKPFKSPIRTPLKTNPNPPTTTLKTTPLRTSTTASSLPNPEQTKPPPRWNTPSNASPLPSTQRSQPTLHNPPKAPPAAAPPRFAPPPRQLESAVLSTRRDIDTLTQAISIVTSTKDAELARLIATWRSASREAAEAVFASARDRVNSMGGVGAMREREE